MIEPSFAQLTPVYFADLANALAVNSALVDAFEREKDGADVRRTHLFAGRYENTYLPAERVPELAPVSALAQATATRILDRAPLRQGFWFNEMHPGQRTTLHDHAEGNELLSAVYYVVCPEGSGRLILHDDEAQVVVMPRPGLLVLFAPDLPHEVEINASAQTRLSIAFNFGPVDDPA
ncbi:MAG: 2OG-Fe(II) oxygenase [Gammaproteobacteria bacterium]|nr:2OG-Fe(II) oxygenase [Gammaproteobacteria bacterium]MCP5318320.1 2OG-Fe(II) oxygenase [Chromatiaceae bacterium]MCW5587726.1 2OG-Fe(II) oxygenase [Chromatiales bacterium]MCP5434937.1 2OG-Fe(II) oxygenase [Chromatiaceae bacterium]HOP15247.1 putative 2OG-Fe(II) oxygenase [Gammaproteobacteria bacterium]